MFPNQFFNLTPHEVAVWLGPSMQGQLEFAWQRELIHRMKKIPQKASELWKEPLKLQTPEQMYRKMRAFLDEQKKKKK